jgi:hypothetical protein
MIRLSLTSLIVFASMGVVHAEQFVAYPGQIKLDNERDPQRIVAEVIRDDGVTLDVTAASAITIDPATLAVWENGALRPKSDGEGHVHIDHNGTRISLPLKVTNAAINPPMSFRNDVEAVIMRAGCNTGACHGSAQGKNGFRLSLFGFDPIHDFITLTREERGRRLNPALPEQSLMLLKPLGEVDHEGDKRFEKDSLLYNMMLRWIAEGAVEDKPDLPHVTGIDILPEEAVMEGVGATQQMLVMAHYSDGTDRDVTDLAILSSVDESLISIDEDGLATAGKRGEAYLMARFSTFAVVSKIITIPTDEPVLAQPLPPKNYIDEFIYTKLDKLRINQAELCDDSVFVRRAYLDILGVLPTVDEARVFLSDTSEAKRATLIDALLERPEFSELWAMKWADVLRVRSSVELDAKGMHRYNDWLRQSITNNKPMDQLVRELLSAEGGNFTSPTSNFYLIEREPNLMAENVAQVFMGVRIQCGQCHNHPFDRWTMDDYYSFSAFFSQVGRKQASDPRETIVFNRRSGEVKNIRDNQVMKPKFLGGEIPDTKGRDRREVLAEWLTSPENPWFSKNFANRIWAHFMGQGIIDPVDDVRVSNPASNPQLLEELGRRLAANNYDMRQLVREICNSNTYQASTHPPEKSKSDTRNFAYAQVRRIDSEMLLDAISQVTNTKVKFTSLPLGARAVQVADGASNNYFLNVFGRPARESVCTCDRRNEPTLAQALHLINGDTFTQAIQNGNSRIAQRVKEEISVEEILEELYMAAYSRSPREEEQTRLAEYVNTSEDRKAAIEDVYWSVLNSKEFVFSH